VYEKVYQQDMRTASRLMRDLEEGLPEARLEMQRLYPKTGKARIIGVTGSPGAGKSTICDCLIRHYRKQGDKVGVVAIDPSSPFSGGAILGDRIRMGTHAGDDGVFIRSLATRGHLGGLSRATGDVVAVMEVYGCDPIIIETVGAGQSEVEVRTLATTSIVVLTPGMGDDIQAIKAGIMEIADLFVLNKADRDGAERAYSDIRMMLEMMPMEEAEVWTPPILKMVAFRDEGIDELAEAIAGHGRFMEESGRLYERARERAKLQFFDLLQEQVEKHLKSELESSMNGGWQDRLARREIDPYSLADKVLSNVLDSKDKGQ